MRIPIPSYGNNKVRREGNFLNTISRYAEALKAIITFIIIVLAVTCAYLLLPIGSNWDEVATSYNAIRQRDPEMVKALKYQSREDYINDVGKYSRDASAKTIYIQAGHGANGDLGAKGDFGDEGVFTEVEYNLMYGMALKESLEKRGFNVVISRTTNNGPTTEQQIKDIAQLKPTAVISIHFNSAEPTVSGTEVFYNELRATTDTGFAQVLLTGVVNSMGTKDRGVKSDTQGQYGSFGILKRPTVADDGPGDYEFPRAMIEVEFITNLTAMKALNMKGPNVFGEAVADACMSYLL